MDGTWDLSSQLLEVGLPDGSRVGFRPFSEGDAEMIKDVYQNGHYDPLEIEQGMVVLDIGAHIGSFSIKAAKKVGPEGMVVSLEPEPGNCRLLRRNVDQNCHNNVVVMEKALSSYEGWGDLFLAPSTMAHSLVFNNGFGFREVEVTTLDGLIDDLGAVPDAIKMDAEGAALDILGASEKIGRCRRIVVAAYHFPSEEVQVSLKLGKLGFKTEILFVKGSVYRSPFSAYIPLVLGWRGSG